jgi:superfamily II DNA/RNA helicase
MEIDSYVHRIGRTARCGNEGTSISFVDRESLKHIGKDLFHLLDKAKQEIPDFIRDCKHKVLIF